MEESRVVEPIPDPKNKKGWSLPPLYKRSKKGKSLLWSISFDGKELSMSHGMIGGKINTDSTAIETNTSGRSIQEQALLEARHRFDNKIKKGYSMDESPDNEAITNIGSRAMLANEYEEGIITNWPVCIQPKLDGVRMLSYIIDGELEMVSRLNNRFTNLDHLEDELMKLFSLVPKGSIIDGELFNPDMDFQEIISAVKTVKKLHPDIERIQYWIFDIDIPNTPYEERYNLLVDALHAYDKKYGKSEHLKLVSCQYARSDKEIENFLYEYEDKGFEGIMIKRLSNSDEYDDTSYEHSRTDRVLKFKTFVDEEGIVVDVEEAKGKERGTAKLIIKDIRGNVFPVRMMSDFATRKMWLDHPEEVIGKKITFRYQELSKYGVPRFQRGVAIRDYE